MAVQVFQPFEIFYDINGKPLDDGFIFIGQANLDPASNPISVFFDEALTIPASQPIRTRNGFPANAGAQAQVFVAETTFSISIRNKNSTVIRAVSAVHSSTDLEGRLADPANPANGAAMVGWTRAQLSSDIDTAHQALDVQDFSPWEYESLVVSKPNPNDPRTWDWKPAIQAAINAAWVYTPGGATFNNATTASMRRLNLGGMTYGLASSLQLPSGGGSGGAGGSFVISGGGLVALSGFPAATPLIRASSSNTFDWTEAVYLQNLEIDCARIADWGVEVQKAAGIYIDGCHIVRYKARGITTSNSAFNVTVTRCYIEAFPFGTGVSESNNRSLAPEAGIYFNSPDCVAVNNVCIGNTYGIRTSSRCRVQGNHVFGNKYGINVTTQFAIVTGNYLEDPIYSEDSLSDAIVSGNFFSDSVRGGAILSLDDSNGQLRGSAITDNTRTRPTLPATGTITLSATTGLITITSTAADFDEYVTTGHAAEGAIITAGTASAVVVPNVSNSTTQVTARVLSAFSGTSFGPGSWANAVSFIALIETTFGPTTALNISATANIQHYPIAVLNDEKRRSFFNQGGPLSIPSRTLFDWTQGDGRGDFWVGNISSTTPIGMGFGTLPAGGNGGSSAIWARGNLEQIAIGGFTAGQYALFTATDFRPGADNTRSNGTSARRWSSTFSREFRPGSGTPIWTSGTGTPEGAVTAPVGSLFTRTDGGALTTLYVKETGAGNTGWVAK